MTDAAISPDGQWAVLRTRSALSFYRASDLLAGNWRVASRVDLTPLKEPQGEGVALGEGATSSSSPARAAGRANQGHSCASPARVVRDARPAVVPFNPGIEG